MRKAKRNPLAGGYSRKTISANIGDMVASGHASNQASAAAYNHARNEFRKKHPRKRLPAYLQLPAKRNPRRKAKHPRVVLVRSKGHDRVKAAPKKHPKGFRLGAIMTLESVSNGAPFEVWLTKNYTWHDKEKSAALMSSKRHAEELRKHWNRATRGLKSLKSIHVDPVY